MIKVELGLGLLSIGREWGVENVAPPAFDSALALVHAALRSGITFYDTAPAYALSEAILSKALSEDSTNRKQITVATKMGEYWDFESGRSYTSHCYSDLAAGIDRSLELLGQIDLLQLHKADEKNIASKEVFRALDKAENEGIKTFGVSVKDVEAARLACECGRYQYIQFPYSSGNTALKEIFTLVRNSNMKAIINRPFAMGGLVAKGTGFKPSDLFQFILDENFSGIVLTGTSSQAHLSSNIEAFRSANS